jgi:CDP-diacylglycerol---glycerol-3-phosphate 3-phosphatidyltransferase
MSDLFASIGILGLCLLFLVALALRQRVVLLRPPIALGAKSRVTPKILKAASIALMAGAGVALAIGHFGWAALLGISAALVDHVDRALLRQMGPSANAAELVAAAVDRYGEAFPFVGLALHFRADAAGLSLVLAALGGSFMTIYADVKAEAMGIPAPLGSARRNERARYLLVGAVLTPIVGAVFPRASVSGTRELPLLISLALLGAVSNASAVQQFAALTASLRARRAENAFTSAPNGETAVVAEGDLATATRGPL